MHSLLLAIHILVSITLIITILLQSGKGADIGAVFGGAGSQTLFGSAGPADFLNKATRILVVTFLITSLALGYFSFERSSKGIMESQPISAPVQSGTPESPVNNVK